MAGFRFHVKTFGNNDPDKQHSIRLETNTFTDGRQVKRVISTPFRVKLKHWNAKEQTVKRGDDNYNEINQYMDKVRARGKAIVRELSLDGHLITAERIIDKIKPAVLGIDEEKTFTAFAADHLSDYDKAGQVARHKVLRTVVRKFHMFFARPGVPLESVTIYFDQITFEKLKAFTRHMRDNLGNNPATIHKNIGAIRSIWNAAVEQRVISGDNNPFKGLKLKINKPERTRLSDEDVKKFMNADLTDAGINTRHARNMFALAFYTGGLRFGDVLTLRWDNIKEGRLHVKAQKNEKRHAPLLNAQALEIIDRYRDRQNHFDYIFPFLEARGYTPASGPKRFNAIKGSVNAMMNKELKKIAKMAGIKEHVHFHVSRHTFGDRGRRHGVGVYDLSKIMGHGSIAHTERYLASFDTQSADDALNELF